MRHAEILAAGLLVLTVSAANAEQSTLVSAAAPTSAVTPAAMIREGDRLLSAGNVQAASSSYLRAARSAPTQPLYQIMAGVALASAGRMDEALSAFRRADSGAQGGGLLTSLLLQGVLSERSDGAAEAQALYVNIVKRYSRAGVSGLDTSLSTERLLQAQKQFGPSPILALLLGDTFQLAEQWNKAEASYRQAIQLAPVWAKPRINLGLCQLAQGHSSEAIATLQGALTLDPANTQARIATGDAQLQSGFVDDAVLSYKKVENSPNNRVAAQAATGIGQAYAQRGRTADAVKSLNRAQQLTPSDPTPAVALGEVQSRAGNYYEAAKAYNAALRLSGGGLFASKGVLYRTLAETQLSAKDSAGAIVTIRRALIDEPTNKPLWYRLWSQALYLGGNAPGGEAKLKQALESDASRYPQDTLNALASRRLIPTLTIEYANSLASAKDDATKVRALRALVALSRFQKTVANEIKYRTTLVSLRPTGPEWLALADAQEQNGDRKSALASYRKALAVGGLPTANQRQAKYRVGVLERGLAP